MKNDLMETIDEIIASRSILDHPFYRAWSAGELDRQQIATYAITYFPHVEAFPAYLREALVRAEDEEVRGELADNLIDELSEPRNHVDLWRRFAAGVGAGADELRTSTGARRTVQTFGRLSRGETASAIAALYAYESQQPEVASAKLHGLEQHYAVRDAESLACFQAYRDIDVRHRSGERRSLQLLLDGGADGDSVLQAVNDALDAYWRLLDEVCVATGVPLDN